MLTLNWKTIKNQGTQLQFDPSYAESKAYKNVTGAELEFYSTLPNYFDFRDCEFEIEDLRFFSSIVDRLTDYCNNVMLEDLPSFLGGPEK